jgi:hypothetical protein
VLLALLVLGVVALALALPLAAPALRGRARRRRTAVRRRAGLPYDPGRERRAEQRARELLRSCVNDEEWGMYRDLGFLRVDGRRLGGAGGRASYAYLVYPHKPIVSYVPSSSRLLGEYCVEFPDLEAGRPGGRLPASDDVLAKWMALTGDERGLLARSNMHLPGRQIDPGRVRRDLWRLSLWERERAARTPGKTWPPRAGGRAEAA